MSKTIPPSTNISSLLHENRVFKPTAAFSAAAHIKSFAQYRRLWKESVEKPDQYWGREAKAELVWQKPFKKVLQWKEPFAKWFVGGRLNASANCLDKWLGTPHANKAALIWEGEPATDGRPGEERVLTFLQLHREVCRFANVLKRQGIRRGDRILIYLPMVPEAVVAMLACARIGAVHSVVFGGFSAQSVADRAQDCGARLVITSDGGYRRGAIVPLKKSVDEALDLKNAAGESIAKSVEKVIVLRRTGHEIRMTEGRDLWWHRELEYVDARPVTAGCRMIKSASEIALLQHANNVTLAAIKATAASLREGMTQFEIGANISAAYQAMGFQGGGLVGLGEFSAFPHGSVKPQKLRAGDIVLIDSGTHADGYESDITRTWVFGKPAARQRQIWDLEHKAQEAAFKAAQPGATCESVDAAARKVITDAGLGPDYKVPGLPHRTGHGIGLDGHEWTNFVRGNKTKIAPGMCFSDEPMIAIYGEFGVRLEDCLYITENGPRFFTAPSESIDKPFA